MEADLQLQRLLALETRLSTVEQQQRAVSKRDTMQFIVSLVVIAATLFGVAGLVSWQNAKLIDSLEKRIEQNEQNNNARMEDLRRDLAARFDDLKLRFDDLKQIVLSQKK